MKKNEEKTKHEIIEDIELDIPEDEIWTYQIPGLAAPHINREYKNAGIKRALLVIAIVIEVFLSIYFSVRAVSSETFEYKDLGNGTYEFFKFSNTVDTEEIDIDYCLNVRYLKEKESENHDDFYVFEKDESKPISAVREYCFNCDERIKIINIGKDVEVIDGKSFYSCWNLEAIFVDDANENYCDIDGVLYTKDLSKVICYPINHDEYLRQKYGYTIEPAQDSPEFAQYEKDVLTYVLPLETKIVGKLAFNYAEIKNIYLPDTLIEIQTLGFFKSTRLANVYSYIATPDDAYISLPNSLTRIESDAFSYDQDLTYMFIPKNVEYIGHHAFWDTVYDEDGELHGITEIFVELSEDDFHKKVTCGDQWRGKYDYRLFKKSVDVNYSAERKN